MLEKMLEAAKKIANDGQCIIRLDMQFNFDSYAWTARAFYSDCHIIDIKQTENGLEVFNVQ